MINRLLEKKINSSKAQVSATRKNQKIKHPKLFEKFKLNICSIIFMCEMRKA